MAGATLSTFTGGWLTMAQQDAVVGYPAQETYTGPVESDHSGGGEPDTPRTGPPAGTAAPGYGSEPYSDDLSGGIITDSVRELGYSAPMADINAQVLPFGPSGPVADTHGGDTGGVERTTQVALPRSPGWWRRTIAMQTFNRQAQVTDTAGWAQSAPNGRQDLNQDQGQDAQGYDPRWLPYSARPITAKLAAEAYPLHDQAGGYIPDGQLPDMYAQGGQGNFIYTVPPDPSVSVQATAAGPAATAQPALGMEYVGG